MNAAPIHGLTFDAKRLTARVTLSSSMCAASEAPPVELLERARVMMLALQKVGVVERYQLFGKRLARTWAKLRELAQVEPSHAHAVTMTLAAGIPVLAGA